MRTAIAVMLLAALCACRKDRPMVNPHNTPVVWVERSVLESGDVGVYHRLGCGELPANRAPFSRAALKRDGWGPCAVCRPDDGR